MRAGAIDAGPKQDGLEVRANLQAERDADGHTERALERAAPKPVESAKASARSTNSQPIREASKLADDAVEAPVSPPRTVKPADAAPAPSEPSTDRLHMTLNQQLAAGALVDAEKSLAELAKLEGESVRVKKARDILAQAKARAVKAPPETKPLPEPARTPTP